LISVYPAGVKTIGFCGRLPLHYASYRKPTLQIIQLLLNRFPEGAAVIDSDGRLPIHLAVVRNAPREAILALIAANPRSLIACNNFGSTPQMLARNEHMHKLLEEEEARLINSSQIVNAEKKEERVSSARSNTVAPKNIGSISQLHPYYISPKRALEMMSTVTKLELFWTTPDGENFGSVPLILARNDHIQSALQKEDDRSKRVSRMMDAVKGLEVVRAAPSGSICKNERHKVGYVKKTQTTGRENFNQGTHKHSSPDKSLSDCTNIPSDNRRNKNMTVTNPVLEKGNGKPPLSMSTPLWTQRSTLLRT